jgi:hypothetical protein
VLERRFRDECRETGDVCQHQEATFRCPFHAPETPQALNRESPRVVGMRFVTGR